jgi:uncharacterized membrane protein
MRHRARLAGYAVHPLLVTFPLGLFGVSVVLDVIGAVTEEPIWGFIATWNIVAGIATGLIAGIFGLLDLAEIPARTRAATVGIVHAILNTSMLGLFGASLAVRALSGSPLPPTAAVLLSASGLALAGIAGWLGSAMIRRLGVTVIDAGALDLSTPPVAPPLTPTASIGGDEPR